MTGMPGPKPSLDMTPTNTLLATGSPKGIYVWFLLALCKYYFEVLASADATQYQVEHATAALVAFCPNTDKRKELWQMYVDLRASADSNDRVGPSVFTIGELVGYLSSTLEFEETSTGALL